MQRPPRAEPLRELAPWVAPRPQTMLALIGAVTLLAAAIAAGAGWWIRSAAAPEPRSAAPLAAPVAVGPVTLVPPARWTPVEASAELPAADPAATAAFELEPGVAGRAIVTLARADHPSLLPPALRDVVRDPLPAAEATTLLGHDAWRYADLRVTRRRTAEVTLVPTTAGVLTVACLSDRADASGAAGCASQIGGLRLNAGDWVKPSADVAARAAAPAVLRQLDGARLEARAALGRAATPGGQQRAARRLGAVHARAAGALSPYAGGAARPGGRRAARRRPLVRPPGRRRGRTLTAPLRGRPPRGRARRRRAEPRGDAVHRRALTARSATATAWRSNGGVGEGGWWRRVSNVTRRHGRRGESDVGGLYDPQRHFPPQIADGV